MICKNCSAEYDDSYDKCPDCGTEKEEMNMDDSCEAETEENPEASQEQDTLQESEPDKDGEALKEADGQASDEAPESDIETEENSEESEESPENTEEKDGEEEKTETETEAEEKAEGDSTDVKEESAEKAVSVRHISSERKIVKTKRRTTLRAVDVPTKSEKRISVFVAVLVCLVGALAVALSAVNIRTDLFEVSDSEEKIVASVGFTAQEEKTLEQLLAKCFSAAKKSYKYETADGEIFLGRINPADKGNIYSVLNNTVETLQTEADPADRFADENGEYAYYKLEEDKVDAVLALFGLEECHDANCRNYYYYDGYYYFAHRESKATPTVAAEIIKSRRILDGSFYVECYFYLESNPEKAKTGTCYIIIEKQFDENGVETDLEIRRISLKPLFGDDGNLLGTVKTYEKKKEVTEGRTDDGKLFSKYILEYPLIEGEGTGYQNVKDFFKNALSVNELKAAGAQKEYETFKENGGEDSQLPFTESIVARVAFEDEKNISIVGKITTVTPEAEAQQSEEDYYGQQEIEPVKLGVRSVEAYTFDKQSGNFVSKDSVVGKDYMLISEILYRIYNSYDYADILPEKQEDEEGSSSEDEYSYGYDEIPDDYDGIGTKIYESAWSLSDEGVTFYYVNEKGYIEEVTLPYSVVEKLTA